MAFDKVVDSAVLESGLTSIANAIREKAGTSDALAFPAGFAEAIASIETGSGFNVYVTTITPATTASYLSVPKAELSFVPNIACIASLENPPSGNSVFMSLVSVHAKIGGFFNYANLGYKASTSKTNPLTGYKGSYCWQEINNEYWIYPSTEAGSNKFVAGVTYALIMGGF